MVWVGKPLIWPKERRGSLGFVGQNPLFVRTSQPAKKTEMNVPPICFFCEERVQRQYGGGNLEGGIAVDLMHSVHSMPKEQQRPAVHILMV